MDTQPNPSELAAHRGDAASSSQAERNLFCPHYDGCLSTAVRYGWDDWTCARCELRDLTATPSATRFANDRRRDAD